jgi:hypothetical protein
VENNWEPIDTTTHQDHVIAHVVGASVLGYLVHDETIHLLLNIGFVWSIYLDGQMVLLPHPMAIAELEVEPTVKSEISADVDFLMGNLQLHELVRFIQVEVEAEIIETTIYSDDDDLRIVLVTDQGDLIIDASQSARDFQVTQTGKNDG